MNGINAIFHLGSVVATLWLVVLLLKLRRQRDLLRRLWTEGLGGPRRVFVATPFEFLRSLADSLGIPFECDNGGRAVAAPARIDLVPVRELVLTRGPTLIRCTDTEVEIHVSAGAETASGAEASAAAAIGGALGGHVRVILVHKLHRQPPS